MSCERCNDIEEIDGVTPQCGACLIPPLSPDEARVLEMRGMLISLKDIVDSGDILRMYSATKEDLEMLKVIEDEFKKGVKN